MSLTDSLQMDLGHDGLFACFTTKLLRASRDTSKESMRGFITAINQAGEAMDPCCSIPRYTLWPCSKQERGFKFDLEIIAQDNGSSLAIDRQILFAIAYALKEATRLKGFYMFCGSIVGHNQIPLYSFRMLEVPNNCLFLEGSGTLDEWQSHQLDCIYNAKEQIIRATTANDLILFLGNTSG